MKKDMMVVGIDVVEDNVLKLELVPLELNSKKKMDLVAIQEKMVNGDSLDDVLKELKEKKQYRDVVYRSKKWCSDNDIIPFRHMVISLELGDMAKERIGVN